MKARGQNNQIGEQKAPAGVYRWLRLALDCLLILLVIMAASSSRLSVRAGAGPQGQIEHQISQAGTSGPVGLPAGTSTSTGAAPALVDDNTLAAVIAAENAALTPPLYFSDLPLIRH